MTCLPTNKRLLKGVVPPILIIIFLSLIILEGCPSGSKAYFTLVRYNPDGSIDSSFGKSGIVVTEIKDFSQIFTLSLQNNGKILAGGTSDGKYALVRYLPDGNIDRGFGKNGKFVNDFDADFGLIKKVITTDDGKILAAGYHSIRDGKSEKYSDMSVIRLNSDGTPDYSFGRGGIALINKNDGLFRTHSIAIQSDGKILVAGTYDFLFTIARLNQDGSIDTNFGGYSGVTSTDSGSYDPKTMEIMVLNDDSIIVAGVSGDTVTKLTLNKDGFIDKYSDISKIKYLPDYGPYFEANAIKIVNETDIITAGTTGENQEFLSFALLKLRFDDSEITQKSKTIVTQISQRGPDVANAIAILPDRKIILGGTAAYNFALVRYNEDGTIDRTFGKNGAVITQIGFENVIYAIIIQPDGKIIAGGYSDTTSGKF